METRLDQSRIERAALGIGAATAREAIAWAWNDFGTSCCVLASMQDLVVVDLAMRVDHRMPVVFLDTGYHFAETLETVRRVERRYGIRVEVVGPLVAPRPDVAQGECCDGKVELLEVALAGRAAWISGVSRVQTPRRAAAALVETDRRGKVKINPLAQWNRQDRLEYIAAHRVITNPLLDRGYTSIGCEPCTTPPAGVDLRSGRWAGTPRTECGLHL